MDGCACNRMYGQIYAVNTDLTNAAGAPCADERRGLWTLDDREHRRTSAWPVGDGSHRGADACLAAVCVLLPVCTHDHRTAPSCARIVRLRCCRDSSAILIHFCTPMPMNIALPLTTELNLPSTNGRIRQTRSSLRPWSMRAQYGAEPARSSSSTQVC